MISKHKGGKIKYSQLSREERMKFLGDFYTMVADLRDRGEVKNFFKDLLTLSEVVMLSRRIQIAQMLLEGITNEEIRDRLKVGYATITSVQRWLSSGFGGYEKIITRHKERQEKRLARSRVTPYSFEWMRQKYPLHFLLINAVLGRKVGRHKK
jgi:TrpR-related protein YerC/YecD